MRFSSGIFTIALTVGTVALAHEGVQNAAVAARMQAMTDIAASSKTLGNMARGRLAFDAEAAEEARALLAAKASAVPALFEENADDPKSEADPSIWENFDDFSAKANSLAAAAEALDVSSAASIAEGFGPIGSSCRSCHAPYRE